MNLTIRPETPADIPAIHLVNQLAFGRDNEARLVEDLRLYEAFILSLVAQWNDEIVGHILFTPVSVTDGAQPWTAAALGPMAVLPAFQKQGVGSALIRHALDLLKSAGHEIVFVVGHPQYYPRFGFKPARLYGIQWEVEVPEEVFMVLELHENALAGKRGIVQYHPLFNGV
ncbi:MAG: N-acetyltransferase [Chloroflexota bacterium]